MKGLMLILLLLSSIAAYSAEPEPPSPQPEEPKVYDHYLFLKRIQESMAGRSLDEQARLQPQIRRAEREACQRLQRDRRDRVSKEEYRRQGGDEFLVFALQLEQYCQTVQH